MAAPFDPYHKWLGIPPAQQPPTHYRLLGLEPFEADPDVIDAAANRQMAYLQDLAVGDRVAESQRLLNEVSTARRTLLSKEKKAEYDARLRPAAVTPAAVEEGPPAEEANPFAAGDAFAADPTPSVRARSKKAAPVEPAAEAQGPTKMLRRPLYAAAGLVAVAGVVGVAWVSLRPAKPTADGGPEVAAKPAAKGAPGAKPAAPKTSLDDLLPKRTHLVVSLPSQRWQPSAPVEAGGKFHVFALAPGKDSTEVQPFTSADALKWEPGEKSSLPGVLSHPSVLVDVDDAAKLGKGRLLLFATATDGGKPALKLFHGDWKTWAPVEASGVELPAGPDAPAARVGWSPGEKRWFLLAGPVEGDGGGPVAVFASSDVKSWAKVGELEMPGYSGVPGLVRVPGEKPGAYSMWLVTSLGKAVPSPKLAAKSAWDPKREQFLDAGTFGGRSDAGWQPVRLAAAGGPLLGGVADTLTGRDAGASLALLPTTLRESGGRLARQLPAALQKLLDGAKPQPHDPKKGELLPAAGQAAPAYVLALDAELDKGGRLDAAVGGQTFQFLADGGGLKIGRTRNYEGAVTAEGGKARVRAVFVADGAWLTLLADGGRFSWTGPLPKPAGAAEPSVVADKAKGLTARYSAVP